MTQLSELELVEVDDWLDNSVRHIACTYCNPPLDGALNTALCGTLFRTKGKLLFELPVGACEECSAMFHKPCPTCGAE